MKLMQLLYTKFPVLFPQAEGDDEIWEQAKKLMEEKPSKSVSN